MKWVKLWTNLALYSSISLRTDKMKGFMILFDKLDIGNIIITNFTMYDILTFWAKRNAELQ